jgi:hypothetical protein
MCSVVQLLFADFIYQNKRLSQDNMIFNSPNKKKKKRGKRNKTLLACFYTTSGLSCLQVSHDEHLISGSVDELWVVSQGRVTPFHGTFLDYKKILQSS